MKWAVKLGEENGGYAHKMGVVSDAFTEYTEALTAGNSSFVWKKESVDGTSQMCIGLSELFSPGDVVTVELERRHGQDGVMRVRVAGKAFVRNITGLPRDGMLYPAVCLANSKQSYSMVAAP